MPPFPTRFDHADDEAGKRLGCEAGADPGGGNQK